MLQAWGSFGFFRFLLGFSSLLVWSTGRRIISIVCFCNPPRTDSTDPLLLLQYLVVTLELTCLCECHDHRFCRLFLTFPGILPWPWTLRDFFYTIFSHRNLSPLTDNISLPTSGSSTPETCCCSLDLTLNLQALQTSFQKQDCLGSWF